MAEWWHLYGEPVDGLTVADDGSPEPAWVHIIVGPVPIGPEQPSVHERMPTALGVTLPWLASFTAEPTELDVQQHTPDDYVDEPDAVWDCDDCPHTGTESQADAHRVEAGHTLHLCRTATGKVMTTAKFQELADEAERGYDVEHLRRAR